MGLDSGLGKLEFLILWTGSSFQILEGSQGPHHHQNQNLAALPDLLHFPFLVIQAGVVACQYFQNA